MKRMRIVFTLLLYNVALASLAALLLLGWNVPAKVIGALYLVSVFALNIFLLRRGDSDGRTQIEYDNSRQRERFYLYACSGMFFCGFVYGLALIGNGELPRATILILIMPLVLGIYLFKLAWRPKKR